MSGSILSSQVLEFLQYNPPKHVCCHVPVHNDLPEHSKYLPGDASLLCQQFPVGNMGDSAGWCLLQISEMIHYLVQSHMVYHVSSSSKQAQKQMPPHKTKWCTVMHRHVCYTSSQTVMCLHQYHDIYIISIYSNVSSSLASIRVPSVIRTLEFHGHQYTIHAVWYTQVICELHAFFSSSFSHSLPIAALKQKKSVTELAWNWCPDIGRKWISSHFWNCYAFQKADAAGGRMPNSPLPGADMLNPVVFPSGIIYCLFTSFILA